MTQQTHDRIKAARDRGSATSYYSSPGLPCIWLDPMGLTTDYDLSTEELQTWREGYANEKDRKDWE